MEETTRPARDAEAAQISLDDFIESNGTEFDDSKNAVVGSGEIFGESRGLAYADTDIMPGEKAKFETSEEATLSESEAKSKIINDLAMEKLKMEIARKNKMSDEGKIRDFIISSEYDRLTKTFYVEHGYQMSGQQKRATKRRIESAYRKGKYRLTDEQKQDLLYELGKASSALKEQSAHALDGKAPVAELSSLITQMQ